MGTILAPRIAQSSQSVCLTAWFLDKICLLVTCGLCLMVLLTCAGVIGTL